MIKRIGIAFALFTSALSFSQALDQGDFTLNPYAGFLGINLNKYEPAPCLSNGTDYKRAVGGGIRGQYIAGSIGNAVYGIGLDLGYTTDQFSWTETVFTDDGFNGYYADVNKSLKRNVIYAGLVIDAHVLRYYDKLDFSVSAMLGYGKVKNIETPDNIDLMMRPGKMMVYNFHLGINYFIIEQLALSLRAGIGTQGILQAGVTFKI